MSKIAIKEIKIYNIYLLFHYLAIRYKVYINEYEKKITDEFSYKDIKASHYILMIGDQKIGTARIIYNDYIAELGRITIIKSQRNKGYGTKFITEILTKIKSDDKAKLISLYAAEGNLVKFYKQFGFIENGKVNFDEVQYVNMINFF